MSVDLWMDYLFGFVPQQASSLLAESTALGAKFRVKPLCCWETLAESNLASFVIFVLCEGPVPVRACVEVCLNCSPSLRSSEYSLRP